jgi:DNA-binding XRE family transcriptional regulator
MTITPTLAIRFPPQPEKRSTIAAVAPRSTNWIDEHLADQVRSRRRAVEMSQEHLGQELGVSVQQIQKYEGAKNRLSAARLYEICQVFDVPIASMFEDISHSAPGLKKKGPAAPPKEKPAGG